MMRTGEREGERERDDKDQRAGRRGRMKTRVYGDEFQKLYACWRAFKA